jgi:3-oxoacyl-[acyl-carrier-protein] synthase-1
MSPSALGVDVVAVGARTPVGLTAASAAAAVRAGISRIAEHPYMLDKDGEPYLVAMDRTLDAHDRNERLFALGSSAAEQALAPVQLTKDVRLLLCVALPELGASFDDTRARRIAARLLRSVEERCQASIEPIPQGNAAGIYALSRAVEAIRSQSADLALVLGVDSHLDPDFLEQLDGAGRLMSPGNRWGYPPGEGACALLLASAAAAGSLGLPTLARIRGLGIAREANKIGTDDVCIGAGLTEALGKALASLDPPEDRLSAIYCDINGERYRTSEYIYAALRLSERLPDPTMYSAPVDCWGDVGAATGPLLTSLAIASAMRGYARGPNALVWASSESGLRGAVLYELPIRSRSV